VEQKRQGKRPQQTTPGERARELIDLLVLGWWDWWPTVWPTIRNAILPFILVLIILTLVSSPFGVTLWDWVQLLIVPAVIAGGGVWFNRQQQEREREIAEQRAQDDAVQSYLDQMTQLLVAHSSQKALSDYMTREVVHARTLHVLTRLDQDSEEAPRRRALLQFLYKTGLLTQGQPVRRVSDENYGILFGANLKSSNLEDLELIEARLIGANLRNVNLRGANLRDADLRDADLRDVKLGISENTRKATNLKNCDFGGANLQGAKGTTKGELERVTKSLKGTIMPDGSKHD
jgi:hypothetical protein